MGRKKQKGKVVFFTIPSQTPAAQTPANWASAGALVGFSVDTRYKSPFTFPSKHERMSDFNDRCLALLQYVTRDEFLADGPVLLVTHGVTAAFLPFVACSLRPPHFGYCALAAVETRPFSTLALFGTAQLEARLPPEVLAPAPGCAPVPPLLWLPCATGIETDGLNRVARWSDAALAALYAVAGCPTAPTPAFAPAPTTTTSALAGIVAPPHGPGALAPASSALSSSLSPGMPSLAASVSASVSASSTTTTSSTAAPPGMLAGAASAAAAAAMAAAPGGVLGAGRRRAGARTAGECHAVQPREAMRPLLVRAVSLRRVPVVAFDGRGQHLVAPVAGPLRSFTLATLIRPTALTDLHVLLTADPYKESHGLEIRIDKLGNVGVFAGDIAAVVARGVVDVGRWVLLVLRMRNGKETRLWVDYTRAVVGGSLRGLCPTFGAWQGLCIGGGSPVARSFCGDIAELVVLPEGLDDSQIAALHNYFITKFA